jgi:hypothetical protein
MVCRFTEARSLCDPPQSAILQTPTYYAGLVATHGTTVVRLPVEPLLQYLHKPDVVRLQEFCRMRMQFRQQQLQSKVAFTPAYGGYPVQTIHPDPTPKCSETEGRWPLTHWQCTNGCRLSACSPPATKQPRSCSKSKFRRPHALRRSKTGDAQYQLCQLDPTFPLYPSNPTSTPQRVAVCTSFSQASNCL